MLRGRSLNLKNRLKKLIFQAINRRRMGIFQELVKKDKAWALYVSIVQKRIRDCEERKLGINYAKASPEQKKVLEWMDIECETMRNLIEIPSRTIRAALVRQNDEEEEDLRADVQSQVEDEERRN